MGNSKSYLSQESKIKSLISSQKIFTRDLYLKLTEKSQGNVIFSPLYIMAELSLIYAGAKGKTKDELKAVLNLNQKSEVVHRTFKDILVELKSNREAFEISSATLVYISEQLSVLPDYSALLVDLYQASIRQVKPGDGSLKDTVNTDVEAETNSRVGKVLEEDLLVEDSKMAVVNATYFKGLWERQFRKSNTTKGTFWVSPKEHIKVPMMRSSGYFNYGTFEGLGASVLSLNYKGGRLSMVIVLPLERDGLSKVEAKLTKTGFSSYEKTLKSKLVDVFFPKFEVEGTIHLKDYLWIMGIRDLFDGKAGDLSGITGERHLSVSSITHKTVIKVDEEGQETDPSASVESSLLCVHRTTSFRVDHPFIFCVRDLSSGILLFTGRVINPIP